jgi:hypothetical protein
MRGQPLSAAEVAEGRLYIVGKKSNVLVANFYISQILAIYTSASTPPIYKVLCATVKSPRRTQTNPSRSSLLAFRKGRSKSADFDRLVKRSRHNLGPVWGKRDRPDGVAVGVCLLAQQLQFVCQTSQQASLFGKRGAILRARGAPVESQILIVWS